MRPELIFLNRCRSSGKKLPTKSRRFVSLMDYLSYFPDKDSMSVRLDFALVHMVPNWWSSLVGVTLLRTVLGTKKG